MSQTMSDLLGKELRTLILLTNFAESRNEKPDTIRKYISRHKGEFENLPAHSRDFSHELAGRRI